jgi:glycosyltransferase involved in cell wall biosynthesis
MEHSDVSVLGAEVARRVTADSQTKARRLLFVVNDCGFFLSHRAPIAIAAMERGYEVHLAALDDGKRHDVECLGIAFHPIAIARHGLSPVSDARLLGRLLGLFRRLRPDVVHAVTIKPVLYGAAAARLAGVPAFVAAFSGTGYLFEQAGLLRAVLRGTVRPFLKLALRHRNARVIFQNSADRARMVASGLVDEGSTSLIAGSGVDLEKFRPMPEAAGPPVVLFAGRLLWPKGVGVFVDAARIVKKSGRAARFVLCGRPPEHNRDAVDVAQIETWRDEGLVEWWGHRDDMTDALAASHIVCLPSHYGEGVPKILIEAAAAGRPVVTTDWPGCRDAVEDGVTGFLVPVRSSTDIAGKIVRLIADADLRITMGRAARRKAEIEFDVNDVIDKTMAIYDELIGR